MEKNWCWCTRLIRYTSRRKLIVPQVRCGMPKRAVVCDLETGVHWWLKPDRIDREGCTVMRSRRWHGKTDWRSLCVVEISCTLSQCGNARIWSGLEDLGNCNSSTSKSINLYWRWCDCDSARHVIAVVKSGVIKDVPVVWDTTKITDVVETCTRDRRRAMTGEGKMKIKNTN